MDKRERTRHTADDFMEPIQWLRGNYCRSSSRAGARDGELGTRKPQPKQCILDRSTPRLEASVLNNHHKSRPIDNSTSFTNARNDLMIIVSNRILDHYIPAVARRGLFWSAQWRQCGRIREYKLDPHHGSQKNGLLLCRLRKQRQKNLHFLREMRSNGWMSIWQRSLARTKCK